MPPARSLATMKMVGTVAALALLGGFAACSEEEPEPRAASSSGGEETAAAELRPVEGDPEEGGAVAGGEPGAPASGDEQPPQPAEPPPEIVPDSLRLVVVHEHELLGSESRSLARIERRLARTGRDVDAGTATEEEQQAAADWLRGEPGAYPRRWLASEHVVVLNVPPPYYQRLRPGGEERPHARGVAGVMILRPPSVEPLFVAQVDERSAWRWDGQWLPGWADDLMDAEGEEG